MVNIEHGGEIRSISSVIFDSCGFKSNNKDNVQRSKDVCGYHDTSTRSIRSLFQFKFSRLANVSEIRLTRYDSRYRGFLSSR